MPELARGVLASPLVEDDETLRRELERRGIEPSGAGALLYAQLREAMNGDLKAASFLRDLAGAGEDGGAARKKAVPDLRTLSDEELLAMLGDHE